MSREKEVTFSGVDTHKFDSSVPAPPNLRTRVSGLIDDCGLTPELRKLLECPACHDIGIPPIYLCTKGHSVCFQCHSRLTACPKCGSGFSSMRNELAESFLNKFSFKCPYRESGCGLITDGGNMGYHLALCDFRPVLCEVSSGAGCGRSIPFNDYAAHVIGAHGVTGLETSQAVISMSTSVKLGQNNWTFPPHFLRTYGETFLCYVHASYNILIAWVALVGQYGDTKDYVSAVTIFDPDKRFLQAKWVGQVHSVRTTPKEVYNSGNCLALLPESFLLFTDICVEEGGRRVKKWKCHFEVIRVSEEEVKPLEGTESASQTDPHSNRNEGLWDDQLVLEAEDEAGPSGTESPVQEPHPNYRTNIQD